MIAPVARGNQPNSWHRNNAVFNGENGQKTDPVLAPEDILAWPADILAETAQKVRTPDASTMTGGVENDKQIIDRILRQAKL